MVSRRYFHVFTTFMTHIPIIISAEPWGEVRPSSIPMSTTAQIPKNPFEKFISTIFDPTQDQLNKMQQMQEEMTRAIDGDDVGVSDSSVQAVVPGGKVSLLGIVDTGATHSIMNWKAANALGIYEEDLKGKGYPTVTAAGAFSYIGMWLVSLSTFILFAMNSSLSYPSKLRC